MLRTLAVLFVSAALLPAQLAEKANEGYRTEEGRSRVAQNLDNPDRVQSQKPRELIASIGIDKGAAVADIGTGVGFMIPFFLEAVGPDGKVLAEDIQQDFLDTVEEKKKERGWENVETILGGQTDPNLPEASVDLAFILDAYHHFEKPVETMKAIRAALKPGGRLALVDFYRSRTREGRDPEWTRNHIRADRDEFRAEVEKAGLTFERTFDHLPYQYALIFKK